MDITISWYRFIEIVKDFSTTVTEYANNIINFMFTEIDDVPFMDPFTPFEIIFSAAIIGILTFRIVKFFVGIITGS